MKEGHGILTSISGSSLATIFGLIKLETITDAAVASLVSLIIGFFGGKIIAWIDKKIKEQKRKRKPRKA